MIAALRRLAMRFGRQDCQCASDRLDAAVHAFDRGAKGLERTALDVVNESVGRDVHPYRSDRIGQAVADVTRRYRKAHARNDR